jgi:hypothetical protein
MIHPHYLMAWGRLITQGTRRPLWDFLAGKGVSRSSAEARVGESSLLTADLRCSTCGGQADCERRLAAGETPGAQCPNALLLERLA